MDERVSGRVDPVCMHCMHRMHRVCVCVCVCRYVDVEKCRYPSWLTLLLVTRSHRPRYGFKNVNNRRLTAINFHDLLLCEIRQSGHWVGGDAGMSQRTGNRTDRLNLIASSFDRPQIGRGICFSSLWNADDARVS